MARSFAISLCALSALLLVSGCGTGNLQTALTDTGQYTQRAAETGNASEYVGLLTGVTGAPEPDAEAKVVRAQQPVDSRLQVYSGDFQISTTDIDSSVERLTVAVTGLGGYLQSRKNARVVVRIPSGRFQTLVARLDELGTVTSRSIETDDVTDQYRDLGLRLGVLTTSSDRLMALLKQASSVDELLKLEAQLSKVTLEIEALKGRLKRLDSEISYSTIAVQFSKRSFSQHNQQSPFAWINHLGPERVLTGFHVAPGVVDSSATDKLFMAKMPMDVPSGFLPVRATRNELQAISPDDARVWYREFAVSDKAGQDFWAKAIRTHLVEHRGCRVIDESIVRQDAELGHDGYYQLLLTAESDRGPLYHLLTISLKPATLWSRKSTIRVTEFTAPPHLYAEYSDAVGAVSLFPIAVFENTTAAPTNGPMLLGDAWNTQSRP